MLKEVFKKYFEKYRGFGKTYWSSITAEIFERCAWYGFFSVASVFLVGPVSEGALGLDHVQKGMVVGIVPFGVYLLPLVTGTIGDKIGYKKMLMASFVVLAVGYFSMSFATGFLSVFGFFALVAIGAGMFKPMITGTVAQVTRGNKERASLGFMIFYMMVNLGGFFGIIRNIWFFKNMKKLPINLSHTKEEELLVSNTSHQCSKTFNLGIKGFG